MTAAIDAGHAALVTGSAAGRPIADTHAALLRVLTRADEFRDAARNDLGTDGGTGEG
jgi:hypothetical protein